jgi:hypothetical protein
MRGLTALACAFVLAAPLPGADDPVDAELAKGVRQVQTGDFDSGIATLDWVARRLAADRGRAKELARAYVYLSVAYLGLFQEQKAKVQFVEALKTDNDIDLSAAEFPPKVLRFFEEARREAFPDAAPPPRPKAGSKSAIALLAVGAAGGIVLASTASSLDPKPTGDASRTPTPTPTPAAGITAGLTLVAVGPSTGPPLRVQAAVVLDRSGTYVLAAGELDRAPAASCRCGSTAPRRFLSGERATMTIDLVSPCPDARARCAPPSARRTLRLQVLDPSVPGPPLHEELFDLGDTSSR